MLSIDEIRERMSDRNVAEVARRLKVTRVWLSAILKEDSPHKPSYNMLERLSEYLDGSK